MKFETNYCPLCNGILTLKKIAGVNVYSCSTSFNIQELDGLKSISHYSVEMDEHMSIQHMYIYPYAIDNFGNESKSRVYKYCEKTYEDFDDPNGNFTYYKLKFVLQTSRINPEPYHKLNERLQMLLIIS